MTYETGFEIRCHLDSVQELIDKGAQSIIISVSYTEAGERAVTMYGEVDSDFEAVSQISPSSPGACPMPCPRRPLTSDL